MNEFIKRKSHIRHHITRRKLAEHFYINDYKTKGNCFCCHKKNIWVSIMHIVSYNLRPNYRTAEFCYNCLKRLQRF